MFSRSLSLNHLYGIDIDPNAINRIRNDGYYTELKLAKASLLPFPPNYFGTVLSNCAVEHMDEIKQVLSEVCRVLKPGGKFVFTVPQPLFFDFVKSDELLKKISLATDVAIAEYNKIHHHVNILKLEEWEILLHKAGLKVQSYLPYLPDEFGRFVARMDLLHTSDSPISKKYIIKLERNYFSIFGLPFRLRIRRYLKMPIPVKAGTHIIIKASRK